MALKQLFGAVCGMCRLSLSWSYLAARSQAESTASSAPLTGATVVRSAACGKLPRALQHTSTAQVHRYSYVLLFTAYRTGRNALPLSSSASVPTSNFGFYSCCDRLGKLHSRRGIHHEAPMLRALLTSGCIHKPAGDTANSAATPSQHIDAHFARLSAYR